MKLFLDAMEAMHPFNKTLTADGYLLLNRAEYLLFASKEQRESMPGSGPIKVDLLDFANQVHYTQNHGEDFLRGIARDILPKLPTLPTLGKAEKSVELFWKSEIISYLGKEVQFTQEKRQYAGIFAGIVSDSLSPRNHFKIQIRGEKLWEIPISLEFFMSGFSEISLPKTTSDNTVKGDFR